MHSVAQAPSARSIVTHGTTRVSSRTRRFSRLFSAGSESLRRCASVPSRNSRGRIVPRAASKRDDKEVWIQTTNVQVLLAALECGLSTTALFPSQDAGLAGEWRKVGRFSPLALTEDGTVTEEDGDFYRAVGITLKVNGPEDVDAIARMAGVEPLVVVDSSAWRIIPAENLVAKFGATDESRLFSVSETAKDAEAMFEALETGVDGVVLRTDDPAEPRELAAYLKKRGMIGGGGEGPGKLELTPATVTRVETVGTGDRVCVDCASAFHPGEGLLVGSFATGLFLVHSECLDAEGYVNSRPFRVNAGALCSYVVTPGGKTAYLSELRVGDDVTCVNWDGDTRVMTVGRVKVEQRQMVLVEAESAGKRFATLLQNAETVRLVTAPGEEEQVVSVSTLDVGDRVLVHLQEGARHTGLKIVEEEWYEQ